MAWAPHPAHSSILALGLSTGRSALYDLSPSTLSPSPNVPSVPLAILQIKHLRPVTSLSFSPVDPSYLAVGLERHRSDHSLLIYDVSDAMALSPPDLETAQHWARPDLRLESTNSQSYTTKEPRHVQAYCPSELVNSVAFMSTGYEVLASTNNRTIRLFDLRAQTGSSKADTATGASHSWTTRAVYGLSPDPLAPERFASFEPAQGQQPSVVRLWDVRRAGEVLSWELHDGAVELEWDGRGGLGVAMKNGGVQVWDVASGQVAGAAEVTGMRQGEFIPRSMCLRCARADRQWSSPETICTLSLLPQSTRPARMSSSSVKTASCMLAQYRAHLLCVFPSGSTVRPDMTLTQ